MNCYLARDYKGTLSAGNKARTDIEAIMASLGYRNLALKQSVSHGGLKHFVRNLAGVIKECSTIRPGDIVVLQYPLKKYFSPVCHIAHARGAKVIALIHDLGSFRRKALTEEKEIRRLSNADLIIAHNATMRRWLERRGCTAKVIELGIFDFLNHSRPAENHEPDGNYKVVYAGNLQRRKNSFLYSIRPQGWSMVLYGIGFEASEATDTESLDYRGFAKPSDLIKDAGGDFGLVWDGDSTRECSGAYGEYLRVNNPHKTSLYIRCGLPVIIWKEAALAPFIVEHGLGLAIGSLEELDTLLPSVTPEQYSRMRKNVLDMAERLANGKFAGAALIRATALLSPNPSA
jgi:hypothetical protein